MAFVDQTSLWLHVVAAAFMIAGGVVQVMAGVQLRSAQTAPDIGQWAGFARTGGFVTLGAAVLSLFSGGHLAGAVWGGDAGGFSNPFITVGMLALLVLAPIGPMVGGARLRRLIEDVRHDDTASDLAALQRAASAPALWGPVHSLVGVSVGLVWIMQHKPNWVASTVIVVATFGLGWLSGMLVARSSKAPAPRG